MSKSIGCGVIEYYCREWSRGFEEAYREGAFFSFVDGGPDRFFQIDLLHGGADAPNTPLNVSGSVL